MYSKICVIFVISFFQLSSCSYRSEENSKTELTCSDNATCIQHLTQELIKGVRENRTVKLFNIFTIEPIPPVREDVGRSQEGMVSKFLNTHALKVDLGNMGYKIVRSPKKQESVLFEIEEYDGRDRVGKTRRKKSTKSVQAILPLMLGVKTASTTMVAIAAVSLLVIKAFTISNVALFASIMLAVKKLIEYFGGSSGTPMQHHNPYTSYNNNQMDFQAGTHPAYSMPQPSYVPQDMYGVTGIQGHDNNLVQSQGDVYDSVGHNTILQPVNSNLSSPFSQPIAGKRWDGYKRKPMFYGGASPYRGYQDFEE